MFGTRIRKRGEYMKYDGETRAKIARYAIENGTAKTCRKFSEEFGRKLSESTVRNMKSKYLELKAQEGHDVSTLPHLTRGAPPILGEFLESKVQLWIRRIRETGGFINCSVVMAGVEAILTKHAKHKLEQHGGNVSITKHFARSILSRMGFIKKRGTKDVNRLPVDFQSIKTNFVTKVTDVIKKHNVPDSLVINFDETCCQMVPKGAWTEENGTQQVSRRGLEDKRQITVLLSITKSGALLPPQLIYAGKTEKCTPKGVEFPDTWDVTYTDLHWSTEDSLTRYVDLVLIPYVNGVRDSLPFTQRDQQAVAIFKAHHASNLLQKLEDNRITPLFVPATCTDILQPLDLGVKYDYKEILKCHFLTWYKKQVTAMGGVSEDEHHPLCVDLKTSTLKPLHARWIIGTHFIIASHKDVILNGFKQAGLLLASEC